MRFIDADEEEIAVGRQRPLWRRWLVAVLVSVALLALGIGKLASSGHQPVAADASTRHAPRRSARTQVADRVPVAGTTARIALPAPAGAVADVLVTRDATWVATTAALLRWRDGVWTRTALRADRNAAARRLLLDTETNTLWVVEVGGSRPARLRAFAASTLRPLVRVTWPRPVSAASPVRGSLYVADARGLFRVTTSGATTRIDVPWAKRVTSLAADPTRDRTLVLVRSQSGPRLAVLGEIEHFRTVAAPDRLVAGSLGVTDDGQIWLVGGGRSGAVVDRLDPGTLRPVAGSRLAPSLGKAAALVATGTSSLLVKDTRRVAALWCIDGSAGAPRRRWHVIAGRGSATHGAALALTRSGLLRLALDGGCPG